MFTLTTYMDAIDNFKICKKVFLKNIEIVFYREIFDNSVSYLTYTVYLVSFVPAICVTCVYTNLLKNQNDNSKGHVLLLPFTDLNPCIWLCFVSIFCEKFSDFHFESLKNITNIQVLFELSNACQPYVVSCI